MRSVVTVCLNEGSLSARFGPNFTSFFLLESVGAILIPASESDTEAAEASWIPFGASLVPTSESDACWALFQSIAFAGFLWFAGKRRDARATMVCRGSAGRRPILAAR